MTTNTSLTAIERSARGIILRVDNGTHAEFEAINHMLALWTATDYHVTEIEQPMSYLHTLADDDEDYILAAYGDVLITNCEV